MITMSFLLYYTSLAWSLVLSVGWPALRVSHSLFGGSQSECVLRSFNNSEVLSLRSARFWLISAFFAVRSFKRFMIFVRTVLIFFISSLELLAAAFLCLVTKPRRCVTGGLIITQYCRNVCATPYWSQEQRKLEELRGSDLTIVYFHSADEFSNGLQRMWAEIVWFNATLDYLASSRLPPWF